MTPADRNDYAKLVRQANRTVFYRTLSVITTTLLGVGLFFAANQYQGAQDSANEAAKAARVVRAAAVQNCQRSVQPGGVRYIIAAQIRQQMAQASKLDYSTFFPSVPHAQLQKLLDQQRVTQQKQIDALLHVRCRAIYPKV
jgi:hypothetical protein